MDTLPQAPVPSIKGPAGYQGQSGWAGMEKRNSAAPPGFESWAVSAHSKNP
jgi:hypothetical protein